MINTQDSNTAEGVHNKVCQSCARPLIDEIRGTNEDKTPSEDYCRFCFLEGKFRDPNITREDVTNRLISVFMTDSNVAEVQAGSMAEEIISKLKRWENKKTEEQSEEKKEQVAHNPPELPGSLNSASE